MLTSAEPARRQGRIPTPSSTARPARSTARCSARWPRRGSAARPRRPGRPTPAGSGASIRRSSASPSAGGRSTPRAWASRRPRCWRSACPADLVAGREFVVTGELEPVAGAEGSVQLELTDAPPPRESLDRLRPGVPIVARDGSRARARFEAALAEFRRVFPAGALLPPDRAGGRGRHDDPVLPRRRAVRPADARRRRQGPARPALGRAALRQPGRDPGLPEPRPDARLRLAGGPDRQGRGLAQADHRGLRGGREGAGGLRAEADRGAARPSPRGRIAGRCRIARRTSCAPSTGKLRGEELGHDEAFRLVLARVLVSPAFLYRVERPGPGTEARPVSDWELASRLSYFLWASMPDDELTRLAAAGRLHDPDVLAAQARRMVRDERARGLATEFACQWLEIRDFDTHDEKSERHFPTFAQVRARPVRGGGPVLRRPVRPRRLGPRTARRRSHVLERVAGEALRHPGRDGPRVAAGRRGQGARPRRRAGAGRDPGEAVGRLADQPGPAGQLAAREPAGRAAAQAAQERPAAPRRRGGDRRPDRPPARREAPQRRLVRRLPQPHRPVRLRPRGVRPDRPAPRRRTWATARSTPAPS